MIILLFIINILLVILAFVTIMRAIKCAINNITDELREQYTICRNTSSIQINDLIQRMDQLKAQFTTIVGVTIAEPIEQATEETTTTEETKKSKKKKS